MSCGILRNSTGCCLLGFPHSWTSCSWQLTLYKVLTCLGCATLSRLFLALLIAQTPTYKCHFYCEEATWAVERTAVCGKEEKVLFAMLVGFFKQDSIVASRDWLFHATRTLQISDRRPVPKTNSRDVLMSTMLLAMDLYAGELANQNPATRSP